MLSLWLPRQGGRCRSRPSASSAPAKALEGVDRRAFHAPLSGYVMYEYACYEGNYALANILRGGRPREGVAAQPSAVCRPRLPPQPTSAIRPILARSPQGTQPSTCRGGMRWTWRARCATLVRVLRGTRPRKQSQESEIPGDDIKPDPCPRCGNPSMLFTPNAQRVPYATPRRYEAAWQCTICGHLAFLGPDPEAGPGRGDDGC